MPKPYYQDDAVTIYHADCREILPQLEPVDLVLTDPPYGLGELWIGGGGKVRSSWKFAPQEAKSWDGATVDFLPLLRGRKIIIWGGNYYDLPPSRSWLIWDKKQPDTWSTGQAELAWTNLNQPIKTFRMAQCEAHRNGTSHPTEKPLALMKWCLKWTVGGAVLDPFMGSGTTLRAAKDLGRKAIGIEIEEKYCEIAAKRMAQEVLPLG